jgi:hypothetical protein
VGTETLGKKAPDLDLLAARSALTPLRNGEVAEWSNAAVLKTVERESVPGVRIPVSPPLFNDLEDTTMDLL